MRSTLILLLMFALAATVSCYSRPGASVFIDEKPPYPAMKSLRYCAVEKTADGVTIYTDSGTTHVLMSRADFVEFVQRAEAVESQRDLCAKLLQRAKK